jgi:Flp pilus assembly protein TadD
MVTAMRRLAVIAVLPLLEGMLAFAGTGWTLARSAHFEVYAHSGGDARHVAAWFERLRVFFEQQTGINADRRLPLRIVAFGSIEEYSPFRRNPTADAYYAVNDDGDFIVLPDPNDDQLAAHEYWHFVSHTANLRLPLWLNEGLAEFFSTVHWDDRGGRVGAAPPSHVSLLRQSSWIGLPALLSMGSDAAALEERSTAAVFYAESWALSYMLQVSPSYAAQFPQLVERLKSGMESRQALESVYGRGIELIAKDLRAWFAKDRYVPVDLVRADSMPVVANDVPSSKVRLLLARILMNGGREEQAGEMYRELALENPKDADAAAGLAVLALRRHNLTEAQEEWRRALEQGINDAKICYRFAMMAEDAGVPEEEVRPALERAVKLDPAFDDALFSLALAENRASEPGAALGYLQAMHHVSAARQFVYWTATSDAFNALARREEAKGAAAKAKSWAATDEQRAYAERLGYIAETDLAVRFHRDASGNVRLETARAPHDASDWNPFIEPGDRVRRVEARLREIACGDGGTVFVVEAQGIRLELRVPDPTHVQMRSAPAEFTCGPQAETQVEAVYAETGPGGGVLRGMEFR